MLLDDLLTILIVAIPAVIAWSIPALRKKNDNIMIAWKTVPMGIIVLSLADDLLRWINQLLAEYFGENIQFPLLVNILLPLAAALIMVVLSGWVIHQKFHVEKRYNPLPSLRYFFPALIGAIIIDYAISMAILFNSGDYRGKWHSIYLPEYNGVKLVFEQQSINPMLAEYNYRLRFKKNGRISTQKLFVNWGGRTYFNIYRLKDGKLLFRDKDWDYVVDVTNLQVFRLEQDKLSKKLYMAQVPNKEINSWSGVEEREGKFFMKMGNINVPAEEVAGILDDMIYFGCITDKFYSAKQKSEVYIEKKILINYDSR